MVDASPAHVMSHHKFHNDFNLGPAKTYDLRFQPCR